MGCGVLWGAECCGARAVGAESWGAFGGRACAWSEQGEEWLWAWWMGLPTVCVPVQASFSGIVEEWGGRARSGGRWAGCGTVPRMARPEYPLEALRKLRDERSETQAHRLAEQVARTHAAELRLRDRERARREHAEGAAEDLRRELARVAAGEATGADLSRVSDFEAATRAQALLLERAEGEAREALGQARAEEQKLRQKLAELEAEAKLVRNHEAGFLQRRADAVQKAEEEAAQEQWNARRR